MYENGWDRDFNETYTEYNGAPLKARECNYCGRELLLEEKGKKHSEYGRLCSECSDHIQEGGI